MRRLRILKKFKKKNTAKWFRKIARLNQAGSVLYCRLFDMTYQIDSHDAIRIMRITPESDASQPSFKITQ